MDGDPKEIFIECPASCVLKDDKDNIGSEGQAQAVLDTDGITLLPEFGTSLFFAYRSISELSSGDYIISFSASTGEKITISALGYRFEDFLRILSQKRNEMMIADMLMQETLKSSWQDASFSLNQHDVQPVSGNAEVRLYDTAMVLMPEYSEVVRIPYSDMENIAVRDYLIELKDETGRQLTISQLGRNFDPFRVALADAMSSLEKMTADMLSAYFPDIGPMLLRKASRMLREGRAAQKSALDQISTDIWKRLEMQLDSLGIVEEYDFLKSLGRQERSAIGIKRGLMGDLTGEYVWLLVPIYGIDKEKPGNAIVMEAASDEGEGKATYFFRIMPRQEYRGISDINMLHNACDSIIRLLNRCMIEINFRREPIYLSDERLQEKQYLKYLVAVQRLPSLKLLRELFIGRVIHADPEQWRKDVLDLLQFNVRADYDNQKWKKGD